MNVNTSDMASKASGEQAPAAATKTPEEAAMEAQMMAAMGMDVSYAIAVPGKILDWSPKEKVTYDAATNKLIWAADLGSKPLAIMIQWDNAAGPQAVDVPPAATTLETPSLGMTIPEITLPEITATETTATETGAGASFAMSSTSPLSTLNRYTEAMMMGQDPASLAALTTDGEVPAHPLRQGLPSMFAADDLSMVYLSTVADDEKGVAEWQAQWTGKDGSTRSLSGMDVVTFDSEGKIAGLKSYVDPTEFAVLQAADR